MDRLREILQKYPLEFMFSIIVVGILGYFLLGMGWAPKSDFILYLNPEDNLANQMAEHFADQLAKELEINYAVSTSPPSLDRYYLPMIFLAADVNENPGFQRIKPLLEKGGAIQETNDGFIIVGGWPAKLFDKNAPKREITVGGYLADAVKRILWRYIPNLSVQETETNKLLYLEGDKNALNIALFLLRNAPVEVNGNTLILDKLDKVRIDLYVMSFCPWGNRQEKALLKLKELLGDSIEVVPHFIYYQNWPEQYCIDENKTFCSMHGKWEAEQDFRETCIYHLYGGDVWLKYANKVDEKCNQANIETCWKEVAEEMGLDVNKILECNAMPMARQDLFLTQVQGITGSPTMVIAGFYGPMSGYTDANTLKNIVCSFLKDPPSACSQNIQESSAPSATCGG